MAIKLSDYPPGTRFYALNTGAVAALEPNELFAKVFEGGKLSHTMTARTLFDDGSEILFEEFAVTDAASHPLAPHRRSRSAFPLDAEFWLVGSRAPFVPVVRLRHDACARVFDVEPPARVFLDKLWTRGAQVTFDEFVVAYDAYWAAKTAASTTHPPNLKLLEPTAAVVSAKTLTEISHRLRLPGWTIADRWALAVPEKMRQLEARGELLTKLAAQEQLETDTISDARADGISLDTPDSEILAMHEIQPLPR